MRNSAIFVFVLFFGLTITGYAQQSKCGIQASDSTICLGDRVILSVNLPKPDATNTLPVPIKSPIYSGLGNWTQKPDGSLIENYSWTYGLPGMLVYGDSTQMFGAIEASVKQTGEGPMAYAGVAMAVKRNSKASDHPFNGTGCYLLSISNGHVSLNNVETPGEVIGANVPGLSVTEWNKVKLEISPNAHVLGYVNDVLYIDYAIPNGVVPKGRFALVTANSWNQYKSVSSWSFPLEIKWSTGETAPVIGVSPAKTTVYNVVVKGAFQTCNNFISINVNQPAFSVQNASICKGEKYRFNNQNLTEAGTYTISLVSVAGCDSTATLNLKVNESTASSIEKTACGNYLAPDGKVYTESGTYISKIPNVAGCDSVITTKLTVFHPAIPELLIVGDTLTSKDSFHSYQWYSGSAKIQGATTKQLIITKSGTYFLEAMDGNGCKSVSKAAKLIYSNSETLQTQRHSIWVIPNPNNGKFRIRFEDALNAPCKIQLINGSGQVQKALNFDSFGNVGDVEMDVAGLPTGIYYLQLISDNYRHTEKVVIQ